MKKEDKIVNMDNPPIGSTCDDTNFGRKNEIKKLKVYYDRASIAVYGEKDTEVREKINEIIDIIKEL